MCNAGRDIFTYAFPDLLAVVLQCACDTHSAQYWQGHCKLAQMDLSLLSASIDILLQMRGERVRVGRAIRIVALLGKDAADKIYNKEDVVAAVHAPDVAAVVAARACGKHVYVQECELQKPHLKNVSKAVTFKESNACHALVCKYSSTRQEATPNAAFHPDDPCLIHT